MAGTQNDSRDSQWIRGRLQAQNTQARQAELNKSKHSIFQYQSFLIELCVARSYVLKCCNTNFNIKSDLNVGNQIQILKNSLYSAYRLSICD